MKNRINQLKPKAVTFGMKTAAILKNKCGEGYIDTAVKILLAIVLGSLLLAGLYVLFGETVLPTLTQRIKEMFNYAG